MKTTEQRYPAIIAYLEDHKKQEVQRLADFVRLGYFSEWAPEWRRQGDEGLKRYTTPATWNKYTAGKITREQATEKATHRALADLDKKYQKALEKLECAGAGASRVDIVTEWHRSQTWGKNPKTTVNTLNYTTTGTASGCGYDKGSASAAEALNKNPAIMGALYDYIEKQLQAGNAPVTDGSLTRWGNITGYGSGVSLLPCFEGGCGVSAIRAIFEKMGYTWHENRIAKNCDYYTAEK